MIALAHLRSTPRAGCFGGSSRPTPLRASPTTAAAPRPPHQSRSRRQFACRTRRSLNDNSDGDSTTRLSSMPEDAAPAAATPPLRMVALDMDGTLLRPDGTVSDRTVAILREIASQGIIVCVASGRPAPTIRRYARQLDIGPLPTVCFNGACAMLLDGDEGFSGVGGGGGGGTVEESDSQRSQRAGGGGDAVWFASTLDVGVVSVVLTLAAGLDLPVQYCLPDKSLASPVGPRQMELVQFFDELVGPEGWSIKVPSLAPKTSFKTSPSSFSSSLTAAAAASASAGTWPGPLPPPLKLIVVTGSQSRADEVASQAREILTPDTCHVIAAEAHVEFLMPRVNKASGLAHVCGAMGVSLDQVVAFGDANNDVEMLQACGMSYAMPNGREAALAAARRRCQFDNAEDGVAVELEALLSEGAFAGGEKEEKDKEGGGKTQEASEGAASAPARCRLRAMGKPRRRDILYYFCLYSCCKLKLLLFLHSKGGFSHTSLESTGKKYTALDPF